MMIGFTCKNKHL